MTEPPSGSPPGTTESRESLFGAAPTGGPTDAGDAAAEPVLVRGELRLYRGDARSAPTQPRRGDEAWSPIARAQSSEGRALIAQFTKRRDLAVYVSGLPGVGKSTLLLHLILDDIAQGRACCVLDPHGDLVAGVLARCPEDDTVLNRILLLDPSDTDWPIAINLLDVRGERSRELAVQFMLELYEALYLREHQGPMLHQSLRNGMRLLMEVQGTLAELPLLFSDAEFLRKRLRESSDPWVHHYFEKVWLPWKGDSRGEYVAYYTSKLSCFLDDSILRNTLGQRAGVDVVAWLNEGGVILANLCRGAIGEANSRLLGMILLHKLEHLAMERSNSAPEERRPVHVYVDEFHEFTTESLSRFLGAARKFNVGLTLAHQHLETLDWEMRDAILGAVGHVILFRQGGSDVSSALSQLVWPRFGERELARLPNYQAVARVTDAEGKHHLGRLAVPRPSSGSGGAAEHVKFLTRAHVARPRTEVEAELLDGLGWTGGDG